MSGIQRISEAYILEVRPIPQAEISTEDALEFCSGESVTLITPELDGHEIEWLRGGFRVQYGGTSYEATYTGEHAVLVTKDGCSAVSESLSIKELSVDDPACATGIPEQEKEVSIFPNPCRENFQVRLVPGAAGKVDVFDTLGKLESSWPIEAGEGRRMIPVEKKGLYLIRIQQGSEKATFKLLSE
jgi:hypothetical protein